jgi:hypothetical protein
MITESDDDTDCEAWAQPHIALADLPRMRIDRPGFAAAAETIVRYEAPNVPQVLRNGDPRLKPFLVAAMARRKECAA